jgi:hypothetical protein
MKKQEVLVMNNIKYLLLACCMHVGLYSQEVGSDSWVQNEARRLGNKNISEVTQADLPKEHAGLVLRELRRRPERTLLIRLRDEETINEIVDHYIKLEGRTEFLKRRMADSRSPWLLPLLAPILAENPVIERRVYGEHGASDFGYPHTTADLMRQIIHKSPEFSEEVQESFAYKGEDPWLLAGMRRWWAENADAVNNEKYLEVKAFDHSDLMKQSPLELYGLKPNSTPESTDEPRSNSGISVSPSQQTEDTSKQAMNNIPAPPERDFKKMLPIFTGVVLLVIGLITSIMMKRK